MIDNTAAMYGQNLHCADHFQSVPSITDNSENRFVHSPPKFADHLNIFAVSEPEDSKRLTGSGMTGSSMTGNGMA